MTTAKQDRLAELIGMIRDTRAHDVDPPLIPTDPHIDSPLSRRHLWQADAVFGGQMTSHQ